LFFTTIIIIAAFIPLFTMQGVEQKFFAPMAYTVGLAVLGSLIMALIIAPALCYLIFRRKVVDNERKWLTWLTNGYRRILTVALHYPWVTLAIGAAVVIESIVVLPLLGTEFLPHLDEGNLYVRASFPQTVSLQESAHRVSKIREIVASFQPVDLIQSQIGRPDDAEDVTGYDNSESLVNLKPYDQWRGYANKDALIRAMSKRLNEIPGISFNFSQNIEDNVEEAITGVKGELALKLFGDNLDVLEKKSDEIRKVMAKIPGVVDLSVFKETGEPQVQVVVDRAKCARYGLNTSDVQDAVGIRVGDGALHLSYGDAVVGELPTIQLDLVLLGRPAEDCSVDHPRHAQKLAVEGPVLDFFELLKRGIAGNDVPHDLARRALHRLHASLYAVRKRGLGHVLIDLLAGEVVVHPVIEC